VRTCSYPAHFKGCPEVAQLAARAVERLGYEAEIVVGRGRTSTGDVVGHAWVEIPELALGIETNPSQMRALPIVAEVLPLREFDGYERLGIYPDVMIGSGMERLILTPAAERFYDELAAQVASCVKD